MYINQKGCMVAAGKVSRSAQLRYVGQKGTPITDFSMKVGEKPSVNGEKPEAIWLKVNCWGDLAETTSGIQKGDRVLVAGKFESKEYFKNGEKRISNEITADVCIVQGTISAPPSDYDLSSGEDFQELPDDEVDVPF